MLTLLSNDTTHPNSSVRIMGYVKGDFASKIVGKAQKKWDFGGSGKREFCA